MGRHPSALGLLITTGCSCLFVALAIGVLTGGPLARLDQSTADALHSYASEALGLTEFFRIVGFPGSLVALALVGVLVAVALLVRRSWRSTEPTAQRSFRSTPTLLRAPALGRDPLQLSQRTGNGVLGSLRDACLLRRAYFKKSEDAGCLGMWSGCDGGPDRVQQGVSGRTLRQRCGRRVCCGGRMVERRHYGSGGDVPA
jgi:hypothetical protein